MSATRSPTKLSNQRLLSPYERRLVERGRLAVATHAGASALLLRAESADAERALALLLAARPDSWSEHSLATDGLCTVYRPIGDAEFGHLLEHNALPATQPYQAIMEGERGRAYAERYVDGSKRVDTAPAIVVEFLAPAALIRSLFARQAKPEDGCMSHGLGSKAAGTLPLFNAWLRQFREALSDHHCHDVDADLPPEMHFVVDRQAWRIVRVKRRLRSR